ncbi:hypothetical protein [Coxiella endosymbiont of Amblyomma nuttalli]|uniref:hypothetical protein n=1 Tax=Coxiella endosymbiont of Amblyomma nuttalli TaxID=2749996 RepID=UPI001BA60FB4|nr:hypothetical protein [Coxiella endosymbiont of Amblyomma nuttalli]
MGRKDLTEYSSDHAICAYYAYYNIETVECVEIIGDLRLGHFNTLIGINLA